MENSSFFEPWVGKDYHTGGIFGKKLLINGLPLANGLPAFPVAKWYGAKLGTPVWNIGHKSTDRDQ